jgi:hypothetical protein
MRDRSASPWARNRHLSPRTQERSSQHSGPGDWMYSPMIDCVTHCGLECSTCRTYTLHLFTALMEEDPSYIAAVKKKQDQSVLFTQWKQDIDCLEKAQEESNCYCDRVHKAEDEVDELHMAVHDLEEQLEVAHGLTVSATAARAANKPLTHTPSHASNQLKPASMMKPTYVPRMTTPSKVLTLPHPTPTLSKVLTLPHPTPDSMQPTDR